MVHIAISLPKFYVGGCIDEECAWREQTVLLFHRQPSGRASYRLAIVDDLHGGGVVSLRRIQRPHLIVIAIGSINYTER